MRILQVSSAHGLGGGETHFLELAEALRQRGHQVVTAGRRASPLKPDITLPFVNSGDFFTALRLRSILKDEAFDILHAHVARDYTIAAASAWNILKTKLVFTRHLLLPIRKHALYRRVDGWIAPTSQILSTLRPLSPRLSAVIPNWVDTAKYQYRPQSLHSPVAVGVLGQISPHKGHVDAIEALRHLGSGFRLLIAGQGESDYVDTLKKKSVGLPVDFLGFAGVSDFFDKIDVLAVPSWEEPFGIVLLEAMASGVPVIATNRGGPVEIILSSLHGILIPPHDPHALADAIRSLAGDDERRSMITRNARELVEGNFDIRAVVPRVEDFYRRVLLSAH
jgi:glycosyltransferase involved in cell wall biosynthesis